MAIYKIFPIQDTTLYSKAPTTNTGIDELLEVGTYNYSYTFPNSSTLTDLGVDDIRRSLLQFDNKELLSLAAIATSASSAISASLKMYVATGENLADVYTLEAFPLKSQWANGLGKYADLPANTGGASWKYVSNTSARIPWAITTTGNTGSYYLTSGGGAWTVNYSASQDFKFTSNKDVNMDVSRMVNAWVTGSSAIPNRGLIVKLASSIENNSGSYTGLKFYSRETHTIYPPHLEIKWNDFTFVTASTNPYLANPSSSISQSFVNEYSASVLINVVTQSYTTTYKENVVKDDAFVLVTNNNQGVYRVDTKYQFSFKARDKYPKRVFQTSSVYLDWKYLPTQSYWGIQDYRTKEMIIDFDQVGTKLSVNPSGSHFTCYMNGLEPERSYKIIIQSTLESGEVVTKDQDIIFKVTR